MDRPQGANATGGLFEGKGENLVGCSVDIGAHDHFVVPAGPGVLGYIRRPYEGYRGFGRYEGRRAHCAGEETHQAAQAAGTEDEQVRVVRFGGRGGDRLAGEPPDDDLRMLVPTVHILQCLAGRLTGPSTGRLSAQSTNGRADGPVGDVDEPQHFPKGRLLGAPVRGRPALGEPSRPTVARCFMAELPCVAGLRSVSDPFLSLACEAGAE